MSDVHEEYVMSLERSAEELETTLSQVLAAQALRARVIRSQRVVIAQLRARINELEGDDI